MVEETESATPYRGCDGRQHLFLPHEIIVLDTPTFALSPYNEICKTLSFDALVLGSIKIVRMGV